MAGKNIKFIIFSLILFCLISSANAQLLVDLAPLSADDVIFLYPGEIANYKITIFNSSNSDYENLKFKVVPQDGVLIISDFDEEQEKYFLVDLKAGEKKSLDFSLKPIESAIVDNYNLSVYYGVDEYSKSSTTYFNVIENPIEVTAKLENSQIDPGSYNKVIFSIINHSEKNIENVSANLQLQNGLSQRSDDFLAELIASEEELTDNLLEFSVEPSVKKNNKVIFEFAYDLDGQNHRFQKNLNLIVEDRSFALYIAGGLLMLLAIFVFFRFFNKKAGSDLNLSGDSKLQIPESETQE